MHGYCVREFDWPVVHIIDARLALQGRRAQHPRRRVPIWTEAAQSLVVTMILLCQ